MTNNNSVSITTNTRLEKIIHCIGKIESANNAQTVIEIFKNCLSLYKSQHHLLTAIPLPGNPIDDLIITKHWPSHETEKQCTAIADDLIIQKAVDWKNFFVLKEGLYNKSHLAVAVGLPRDDLDIMIIPIDPMYDYQAVCVFTFEKDNALNDEIAMNNISYADRTALKCAVSATLIKLREFGTLPKRDGELSSREREVVSCCALGYTAGQIARQLKISERTVTAHLQNSSHKLQAQNKTECVIQAIRYNQIGVGSKTHRGFYEIEHEILTNHEYDNKKYF